VLIIFLSSFYLIVWIKGKMLPENKIYSLALTFNRYRNSWHGIMRMMNFFSRFVCVLFLSIRHIIKTVQGKMLTKVYRNGKKKYKVTTLDPFLTLIIIWVLLVFTFVSGSYIMWILLKLQSLIHNHFSKSIILGIIRFDKFVFCPWFWMRYELLFGIEIF